MTSIYPHQVDGVKSTIGCLPSAPQFVTFPAMSENDFPYLDIGRRLEAVRMAYSDLNQRQWAEKHGFNHTQYNNWALGKRRITVDAAEQLCDKYHLTLDAIYRGNVSGLSEKNSKIF